MTEPAIRVSLDVSAVPDRPAGAGRYIVELAAALARRADVDLVTIAWRGDGARWRQAGGEAADVVDPAPRRRPIRLAWEQVRLPGVVESLGPAVHHSPHYTMPERTRLPVIVTVHDCTFFDHPEWHERSKVIVFRRAIRVACRRAATIVCVSSATEQRLREACEVRVPVVVAPHGVDHARFGPEEPSPGADRAIWGGLGLDPERPTVVFVGTLEPRKGVAGLVAAFDAVASRHPDAQLVLAGQPGWGPDEVGRALGVAAHGDRIFRTGYVPDVAVPALLRRAAVVAYPSLEEGFGLPALEALACGAPLLTTSGTAMEELAHGVGTFVAPADVPALTGALDALLEGGDAAARDAARRGGLAVAAARTWDASAATHVAVYRQAMAAPFRH